MHRLRCQLLNLQLHRRRCQLLNLPLHRLRCQLPNLQLHRLRCQLPNLQLHQVVANRPNPQACLLHQQVMKVPYVPRMMNATLHAATSASFPLAAEKRSPTQVIATVTSTVNLSIVWVASALMAETVIGVTPTTIVNLGGVHSEYPLASARHQSNMVKTAFETTTVRLNTACFLLALTIVMVHIV